MVRLFGQAPATRASGIVGTTWSGCFAYVSPLYAVEMFFVISGFYMALVLGTKYSLIWRFYSNRLIRLMPSY